MGEIQREKQVTYKLSRRKRKVRVLVKGLTTPLIATGAQARGKTLHMGGLGQVTVPRHVSVFLSYEQN